jgi:hypothetical protein
MSLPQKARNMSPFFRGASRRRFGISKQAFIELERMIEKQDATVEQLRGEHPNLEVHYGDKETLEESRFPWLKKRRRW